MSVKPIFPRILDPSMLPGDTNDNPAPNVPEEEQHGLFTTIYENKMLVIIIVLVILIIGIFAYVVIRKKEEPMEAEQMPLQSQQLPPSPPQQQQQPQYNDDDLRKMMGEMEAAKHRRSLATAAKQVAKPPPEPEPEAPKDNIVECMKEAAAEKPDDFDDEALKIIDEQTGLNESSHNAICGAPTAAGGFCKLRAVVDGRCRKHIGV